MSDDDRQGNRRGPTPVVYGVPTSATRRPGAAPADPEAPGASGPSSASAAPAASPAASPASAAEETTVAPRGRTGGSDQPAGGRAESRSGRNGAAQAAPAGSDNGRSANGAAEQNGAPIPSWFVPPRPDEAAAGGKQAEAADPPTQVRGGKSAGGRGASRASSGRQAASGDQAAQPRRETARQAAAGARGAEDRARSPLTDPALSRPDGERSSSARGAGAGAATASGRGTAASPPPAAESATRVESRAATPLTATPDAPSRRNGVVEETAIAQPAADRAAPETPTHVTPPREQPQPQAQPRSVPQPPAEAFAPGPRYDRAAEAPPYSEDDYARAQEALGRGPAYNVGREQYAAEYAVASQEAESPGSARRAHLRISRVSPKSVFKISFMFSLCVFVIILVAVAVLWFVLDSIGVFHSIEDAANTLNGKPNGGIDTWLGFQRVIGIAFIIGVVDILLMTVLGTLGALLYNLCTDLVGGVEVTLTER